MLLKKGFKTLAPDHIISLVKSSFDKIKDHRSRKSSIPIADAVMSVFAMFKLKMPSLLQLETQLNEPTAMTNLQVVFKISTPASDQGLRDIIDNIACSEFLPAFKAIHTTVQRTQVLNNFKVFGDYCLVAVDGTEMFTSKKLTSDKCLTKNHRNGEVTSHMQVLVAAIVHPELKFALPFMPEPIQKADGSNKNDCETNAFVRFQENIAADFPARKFIYLLDSLYSKSPTLFNILSHGNQFIANCKEGDHKTLFEEIIPAFEATGEVVYKKTQINGVNIKYRFINEINIFKDQDSINCNFLEVLEQQKDGTWKRFTWLTSLPITAKNFVEIMRCGRSRWRIENEIFNCLKQHGYNFERNYGLGANNLRANFAILVMLAFLTDQVNELGDINFAECFKVCKTKKLTWASIANLFCIFILDSYDQLIAFIANRNKGMSGIKLSDISVLS